MKIINHFLFNFILFTSVFFTVFSIAFSSGFCSDFALTLDTNSAHTLETGAGGDLASYCFNAGGDFGVYGVNAIIDDINTKLYQNYGWDMETVLWDFEDGVKEDVKSDIYSALAGGATISNFAKLYSTTAYNSTWGKLFVLGEENAQTGELNLVSDNMYVKVHQQLIDNYLDVRDDLKQNSNILDFSNLNVCFSDNFTFYSNYDFSVYSFNLNRKFLFYNSESVNSNSTYQQIGVIYPDSLGDLSNYFSSGFGIGTSGSQYSFDNISCDSPNYTVINGVTYRYGTIRLHYNYGWSNLQTMYKLNLHLDDVVTFLRNMDLYGQVVDSYSYNFKNGLDLTDLLAQLNDHYVTTEDLAELKDLILDLPVVTDNVGAIVIDDSYADALSRIEALVQELLEAAEIADEGLGNGENNNNNNNENEIVTEIPLAYWPSFITDLLPAGMFSMFQPIFDIVGSTYSVYGLWILIPSILIFVLALYIIVSLL